MKKNDYILASAMLFIALVWFLINTISSDKGELLVLYKDNHVVEEFDLSKDIEYCVRDLKSEYAESDTFDSGVLNVNNTESELLKFKIVNGKVDVLSANCPDKLCVHQKPISNNDEVIVCLPNKIVLKIESKSKNKNEEYDAISK